MPAEGGAEVVTSGGQEHRTNPPPPEGGQDHAAELAKLRDEHAKAVEQAKELQSRYADAEQKLREFGRDRKRFDEWTRRIKEEPEAVITEMGGDPVLAAARALPQLEPKRGDDDGPPDWFKQWSSRIEEQVGKFTNYQEEQKAQASHYQRVGQLQAYLNQEGVADKYPLLKLLGPAGVQQVANVMREREDADGVPPNLSDLLKEQEQFLDRYNRETTKMWAKNKLTAKRMVDALQEEGYSIHAVGARLTLMNEDDGYRGDEVDTSKLQGDELIRYHMEQADRKAAAERSK